MPDQDARSGSRQDRDPIIESEEFEEALASSRYAWGGRNPPHRANGADRARRPKADKEGQGAEGSSEAEGRLEGHGANGTLPMGPTGAKRGFWGGSAQKEVRRLGSNRLTWWTTMVCVRSCEYTLNDHVA